VTLDDFEYLAKATPGLRIARTKAVRNDDLVTVIVVPYTLPNEESIPKGASEGFKKTVCMHLDRHRILTTRMKVIDPEYVVVSVHAAVKIKPLASASPVQERIIAELKTFFDPLEGYDGSGWPFGRNVYRSEVCAKIEAIEGVDCVQSLNILAEGNFTYKDGNVTIGKTALVRSGKHSIEIVEAQEPCKSGWQ
jgi:predicted phage baseplate assembly protein